MASAVGIAKSVIIASQKVPLFAGRGSYSSCSGPDLAKAEFEFNDSANFLENLPDFDFRALIRGAHVLDFGSGYGGRTAWMSQYAARVDGLEIFPERVATGRDFSAPKGFTECRFHLSEGQELPFADSSFDVISTFDVMEHVGDPVLTLGEFRRVLKPSGIAVIIFTPYLGAFAHHLNFVTLAPALHWVFSPRTLLQAISGLSNIELAMDFKGSLTPQRSYNNRRDVLPTLNGMTKREFDREVKALGFSVVMERSRALLEKFPVAGRFGSAINRALCSLPILNEALGFNLTAILRKP